MHPATATDPPPVATGYVWPWSLGVTPQQVARLDRLATHRFGPSLADMVQAAGTHLARVVDEEVPTGAIGVLAGPGMNGAGATVAARILHESGRDVALHALGQPHTLEAVRVRATALHLPHDADSLQDAAVLVDGLLGYRAHGAPRGDVAAALARFQEARWISLDVETGVDPATGRTAHLYVDAELVVALACLKRGTLYHARRARVVDIGIPGAAYAAAGLERPPFDGYGEARPVLPVESRQNLG